MGVDLTGKAAAITGASSGIGAALALACVRAGMPVALMARRVDRLEAVRQEIERLGGRAVCVAGSVDSDDDCQRLIDETVRAFGSVYAVVANAGYGEERPSWSMPEDAVRAMFETNFYGSMRVVRPAVERMRSAGGGHAVFVSSCLSKIGVPHYAAYCATKAAQDHFARAMRHELAGDGVAVSSVHPIGTKTEFFDTAAARSAGGCPAAGSRESAVHAAGFPGGRCRGAASAERKGRRGVDQHAGAAGAGRVGGVPGVDGLGVGAGVPQADGLSPRGRRGGRVGGCDAASAEAG
jgi:short-subunit dehydrogenase